LKWIAAVVMICNVVVYLWASGRQMEAHEIQISASPDVNKEGMLLLREVGSPKKIGIIAASKSESALTDGSIDQKEELVPPTEEGVIGLDDGSVAIISEELFEDEARDSLETINSGVLSEVEQCYRIGPFKKDSSWGLAQEWMRDQGVEFEQLISESRELRAVRVFLGPFVNQSDVNSAVSLLKGKNLDHFVYQVENGSTRVSLGYFTQEELANKFLNYLQGIKVVAKSQPEYRILGPFNWMQFNNPGDNLKALQQHQWNEAKAGLSQLDC
jgi:hypothetical protein